MLAEFGDKALRCGYDPWVSVGFHGRDKVDAYLNRAYKNVGIAANVETGTKGTGSPEGHKKLLHNTEASCTEATH